jgi:hypothetical protein
MKFDMKVAYCDRHRGQWIMCLEGGAEDCLEEQGALLQVPGTVGARVSRLLTEGIPIYMQLHVDKEYIIDDPNVECCPHCGTEIGKASPRCCGERA